MLRGPIVDEPEALKLDVPCAADAVAYQNKGRRRAFASCPVIRLAGPLQPVFTAPGSQVSSHHALGLGHNYYS